MMEKIRIVIADDHAILREGIRALLSLYPDMEIVGEASDGLEAIDKARELSPDVILMDIAMPGLGGLEATLEVRKVSPDTKVLVLTQYDNKEYISRFLKAGAAGYVLKKAVGSELLSAIRAVYRGGSFLDPSVTKTVIEGYLEPQLEKSMPTYDRLTDREKQVLKLAAEGYTNKEIAEELVVSIKTIMAHRASIMEKLDLHNRADLIKYAIRNKLIDVEM